MAGRAGRGEFEGKVIVQTYNPEHYSIQCAKEHDYVAFYNKEIVLRKEFDYPPFTNIISVVIYGEDNRYVAMKAKEVYNLIIEEMVKEGLNELVKNVIGPYPAPLEKIKNNYRFQILIKSRDEYMDKLKNIIEWVCIINRHKNNLKGIRFSIDVNPNSIL